MNRHYQYASSFLIYTCRNRWRHCIYKSLAALLSDGLGFIQKEGYRTGVRRDPSRHTVGASQVPTVKLRQDRAQFIAGYFQRPFAIIYFLWDPVRGEPSFVVRMDQQDPPILGNEKADPSRTAHRAERFHKNMDPVRFQIKRDVHAIHFAVFFSFAFHCSGALKSKRSMTLSSTVTTCPTAL